MEITGIQKSILFSSQNLLLKKFFLKKKLANIKQQLFWGGGRGGDLDVVSVFFLEGDEFFCERTKCNHKNISRPQSGRL